MLSTGRCGKKRKRRKQGNAHPRKCKKNKRLTFSPGRTIDGVATIKSTRARINDPDMLGEEDADAVKGSPSALWRAAAAAMYLIPWMDCLMLGRFIFQEWTSFQIFHDLPMPLLMIYGCNAFMPLIIFFVLFLCVVRNTKLPHFLRFSAMQSIMLDIVVMLANILVMYAPSEVTHSILMPIFMNASFVSILATIFYCMIHTLAGRYCDLPWISEAVYIQVTASEFG